MPKVGMQPIRRQQLIQATFDVIQNNGLEEATVATVANAAGLSAGIVAHYFGNKDGMLEAAMRQILRDLRAA
ncbi:MAG: TetR family transcriptional regulator, partial [Azonexus sp.]|nr:TetR family transcriptional regulator [Azonexus sp.]